jgi:hypothetical protein
MTQPMEKPSIREHQLLLKQLVVVADRQLKNWSQMWKLRKPNRKRQVEVVVAPQVILLPPKPGKPQPVQPVVVASN